MVEIGREEWVILSSLFVVFLGFLTALINGRSDHVYRTLVAMLGLSVPLVLQRRLPDPPAKLRPFLAPVYNEKTMAVLSAFIAVHVSLVNIFLLQASPFRAGCNKPPNQPLSRKAQIF